METCPDCGSTNIIAISKGSRRMVDGEVDDDIRQVLFCLSCGWDEEGTVSSELSEQ